MKNRLERILWMPMGFWMAIPFAVFAVVNLDLNNPWLCAGCFVMVVVCWVGGLLQEQ